MNGEKLTDNAMFWVLRPGSWTLEVRSGEMRDRVTFQVELAENKTIKRGFSVAPK